jgi:hypothetical protein
MVPPKKAQACPTSCQLVATQCDQTTTKPDKLAACKNRNVTKGIPGDLEKLAACRTRNVTKGIPGDIDKLAACRTRLSIRGGTLMHGLYGWMPEAKSVSEIRMAILLAAIS